MSFPYRLFTCFNCKKSDKTIIPPSQHKVFNHLYKLRCATCNETWLVCPEHNLRWGRQRFYQAILHLDNCSHKHYHLNLPRNFKQNQQLHNDEQNTYNLSNPPTVTDYRSENSNIAEEDSISFTDTEDESISLFLSYNQELCFEKYNVNLRRFIEAELQNEGDGMKRIVSCAFRMDLYTDILDISLEEA